MNETKNNNISSDRNPNSHLIKRKLKMNSEYQIMVDPYILRCYDADSRALSLSYTDYSPLCSVIIKTLLKEGLDCMSGVQTALEMAGIVFGKKDYEIDCLMIEMDDYDRKEIFEDEPDLNQAFQEMIYNKDFWKAGVQVGIGMYKYDVQMVDGEEYTKTVFHLSKNALPAFGPHDEMSLVLEFADAVKNTLRLGDIHRQHILGLPALYFQQMREGMQMELECYNRGYAKMTGRPAAQIQFHHYEQAVQRHGAPQNMHFVPVSIVFEE